MSILRGSENKERNLHSILKLMLGGLTIPASNRIINPVYLPAILSDEY
jgi:hypothetical protein